MEKAKIFLPKNVIITCIGPGTAEVLKKYNFSANYIPPINTSENLLSLPNFANVIGHNIILVKGIGGRNTINLELIARGANIQDIEVYERKLPNINPNITQRLWQEDGIDIIIFTSTQAMLNTFALFPSQAKEWLLSKTSVVISERIAVHAKNLGFKNIINTSYANILAAIQGQI